MQGGLEGSQVQGVREWLFAPGYDSDVAREKNMDYMSKTYANPIRATTGVKPHQQDYEDEDRYVSVCSGDLHAVLSPCQVTVDSPFTQKPIH